MHFKKIVSLLALVVIFAFKDLFGANVGLLVMATGKYIRFVPPLIKSAEQHFCKNHNVTFFIFTDGNLPPADNVVTFYQPKLGWPYDTMMRYHSYAAQKEILAEQDYLFACDADMRFVDTVGDEILGDRVAVVHPGFVGSRGTYETNSISKACIYGHEGKQYYAGGFYGASGSEFIKILETNIANIDDDLKRGYIAIWHDESHWNRYCVDHPPTVVLSPSYCYPESWNLPFAKKLLALDKNHHEMRN